MASVRCQWHLWQSPQPVGLERTGLEQDTRALAGVLPCDCAGPITSLGFNFFVCENVGLITMTGLVSSIQSVPSPRPGLCLLFVCLPAQSPLGMVTSCNNCGDF